MTVRLPRLQEAFTSWAPLTALVGAAISMTVLPETYTRPYLVWQIVSAVPENTLACPPEVDDQRCRVFIWADNQKVAKDIMQAAVDAVANVGQIVFGPFDQFEEPTRLFGWVFDVEVWTDR